MTLQSLAALKGVAKALNEKALRIDIAPGAYKDIIVELRVTVPVLNIGASYSQEIVAKAKPWDLLAVALSKLNGVTVESLVKEANGIDKKTVTAITKRANEAMGKLKEPTKTECSGKITLPQGAKVTVSPIKGEA